MENKIDIISKYNISEQDLYTLGIIEAKKDTVGFFDKEKLKAKSLGVLKPYNVKFMDLGNLLNAIKTQGYHANQTLIDKYGTIDIETKASSMGLKYVVPIVVGIVVFFYIFNSSSDNEEKQVNPTKSNSAPTTPCVGSQNCITQVRNRVSSVGSKQILAEQYEINGVFQIQFLDYERGGNAYNATVTTDCNCNITNVNVTVLR